MRATLERARETARTTRELAKHLGDTALRDRLMLELVTLEAVIRRCETALNATPDAIAELKAETDRLRLEIGDAMDPSRKLH